MANRLWKEHTLEQYPKQFTAQYNCARSFTDPQRMYRLADVSAGRRFSNRFARILSRNELASSVFSLLLAIH
jgi:hypothetical protein